MLMLNLCQNGDSQISHFSLKFLSWRKSMKPTVKIWSGKVYQDKQGMLSLKKYPGYDECCVK